MQGDVRRFEDTAGDRGNRWAEICRCACGGGAEEKVQCFATTHAVAHQEEGLRRVIPVALGFLSDGQNETSNVLEDLRCRACEASLRGFMDGATPTALVEAMNDEGIGRGGQNREEVVVCIDVIGETVEEDEMRCWWAIRLD